MRGLSGALLGAAACAALGLCAGARLSARCARLRRWQQAILQIRAQCAFARAPLGEALRAGGALIPPLAAIAERVEREGADPAAVYRALPRDSLLTREEEMVIAALMQALGAGGEQEQRAAFAYALERLSAFCLAAEGKRARDARLYASLGCLFGACVFLLLL